MNVWINLWLQNEPFVHLFVCLFFLNLFSIFKFCAETIIFFFPYKTKNHEETGASVQSGYHLTFGASALWIERIGRNNISLFFFNFNRVTSPDSIICADKKKLTSFACFLCYCYALPFFPQTFPLASVCGAKVHSQFCRKYMTEHYIIPFELILLL